MFKFHNIGPRGVIEKPIKTPSKFTFKIESITLTFTEADIIFESFHFKTMCTSIRMK